jgi:hypothetical protein
MIGRLRVKLDPQLVDLFFFKMKVTSPDYNMDFNSNQPHV